MAINKELELSVIELLNRQAAIGRFKAVMNGQNPSQEAALKAVSLTSSDEFKKILQIIATWLGAASFAIVATAGITFAVLSAKLGFEQALVKILTSLFEATQAQLIGGFVGGVVAILVITAAAYLIQQHLEQKAINTAVMGIFANNTAKNPKEEAAQQLPSAQ